MKRKGLALLLALCLVLTLLPMLASADSDDVTKSISINDKDVEFLVVKGERIHIDTDSGSNYVWEEVSNKNIVTVNDDTANRSLILTGKKVGTATFKLVIGKESTTFDVKVLSNEKGISLSSDSIVVAKGGSKEVTAVYNTGTTTPYTPEFSWSSEDTSIATVNWNYDESDIGVVEGKKKGETTISVRTSYQGNQSKSLKVCVEDPYKITYAESDKGVLSGVKTAVRTDKVTVKAEPEDNYKVSSIKVVSDDGKEVETSRIDEKSVSFEMPDHDVTVSAEYEVIDPSKKPLKDFSITEKEEVPVKAQFAISVTLDPEDATDAKVEDIVWTSKSPSVAIVEDGVVTGISEGTAKIVAELNDIEKVCEVTVTPALTSVEASEQEISLTVGKEKELDVSYKTSKNESLIAEWISADPSIAAVDKRTGKVTGVKAGETKITVTVGEKSDNVKVTVKKSEGDYKITVNSSTNGTVSASKSKADKGEEVVLTAVPATGYELGEIKVVDKNNKQIELTKKGEGYAFVMPESDVVVQAAFAKKGFIDVPSGIWYEEAVNYAAAKGYLDGVGNNRFDPNGAVTRGQLCTILFAMEGKPTITGGKDFPDVKADKYYYDPIRWASSNDMVAGYTDGTFKPDVFVSRQQLAAVLYKYASYKKYDLSVSANITTFADYSAISNYAITPMRWAVSHKVMSGTDRNTLLPQSAASRAQFAVMLKAFDTSFGR